MTVTRTARSIRKVLLIAAALALLVLPAAAAVDAQDSAATAAGGSVVADGTVAPAPAVADAVSSAAAESTATRSLSGSEGSDGAGTPSAAEAEAAAAAVPSDAAGSTEAKTVQRSCGAAADPHYVPASGKDSNQCYDSDGKFQSSRKYTATQYTNEVQCGHEGLIYESAFGQHAVADGGTDGGYVGFCDDGALPGNGRVTASADAGGSARVVADGDQRNPEETTQGWADATVSADGPEYRCGKAYDDGGRGSSDAPTSADNADQCSP